MNEPNSTETPLAALIKRLRNARGLSLHELARRSGYDRSNLRRVEAGSIASLSTENSRKLADALDVDVELFFEAIWQTNDGYLPSLPTYFRQKYQHLSAGQIAAVEQLVETMRAENDQHDQPSDRNTRA